MTIRINASHCKIISRALFFFFAGQISRSFFLRALPFKKSKLTQSSRMLEQITLTLNHDHKYIIGARLHNYTISHKGNWPDYIIGHEETLLFSLGLRFLIKIDSTIFRSGWSFARYNTLTSNGDGVSSASGCVNLKWSPIGVSSFLLSMSRTCSLYLKRKGRLVSPTYSVSVPRELQILHLSW